MQKLSYFRTSASATSCGVVTTRAPSFGPHCRNWTRERCSSEVPGGAEWEKRYCRWWDSRVLPSLLPVKIVGWGHFFEALAIWQHRSGCSTENQWTWQQDRRSIPVTILSCFDALLAQLSQALSAHLVRKCPHPAVLPRIFAIATEPTEWQLCSFPLLLSQKAQVSCVWWTWAYQQWWQWLGWLKLFQKRIGFDWGILHRLFACLLRWSWTPDILSWHYQELAFTYRKL